MFEEYKNTVLEFYLIKKSRFLLSNNLESPNREKLRKECVIVFLRKNSKVDKDFIRSFFDPTNRYNDQVRSIEKFKLDKLRPLVSFLTEGTNTRDEENIKLLAWLIDFPIYEDWRNNPVMPEIVEPDTSVDAETTDKPTTSVIPLLGNGEAKIAESENPKDLSDIETPPGNIIPPTQEPEKPPRNQNKNIIVTGIIVLFVGTGLSLFWKDQADKETITKDEKCMYWTGEHYEAIACGKKTNISTLPLDTVRLRHLERITQPDTLTKNSLGKVWYGKVNGKPIFYTAGGEDPLDSNKRLLPMTNYIKTKYTSNYRYLLHLLIWSFSFFALITLLAFLCYRYFSKSSSIPLLSSSKKE